MRICLKICCISSRAEAELAMRTGASALGLVSAMPSGPGVISEERISDIAARTPVGVAAVLLTSLGGADDLIAQQRRCRADVLQLCEVVPHDDLKRLRDALPGTRLMHVVHVGGEESIAEAEAVAPLVDALLLDTGARAGAVRELGGTGRTHDWAISARIVAATDRPTFLAGGLHAGNVGEAIATVRPYGIDVCSGVRTAGALDPERVRAFTAAINAVSEGSL
jgi:phosphoribosylanthranilate isomerase